MAGVDSEGSERRNRQCHRIRKHVSFGLVLERRWCAYRRCLAKRRVSAATDASQDGRLARGEPGAVAPL
jgi:hypothetical protein